MTHFDKQAAEWDKNKIHFERCSAAYNEIKTFIDPNQRYDILEYGCGTAILSFMLEPHSNKCCLIDSSPKMLEAAEEKIKTLNLNNYFTGNDELLKQIKTDIIIFNMSLHHISNYKKTLSEMMTNNLKPGGIFIIIDLFEEDGSFHTGQEGFEGHNGFDLTELENFFIVNRYSMLHNKHFFTINKKNKDFPLFILAAKK